MLLPKSKLEFFAKFIEEQLGIHYSDHNFYQLQNRLQEIVKVLGMKDFNQLWDKVQSDGIKGDIHQLLVDDATNNETSFFRDPNLFSAIKEFVVPEILKENPHLMTIRIWSAASSFGQEPYTLAMLLEELKHTSNLPGFEIVATDIADRALNRASQGRYTQLEVQRGLPAPMMVKYFTKDKENFWTVKDILRKNIKFKKQNLLEPFTHIGVHNIIMSRNVLIYQRVENKQIIIKNFVKQLAPGGFLILGAGESLIGISDSFETIHTHGVSIFRLKAETSSLPKAA